MRQRIDVRKRQSVKFAQKLETLEGSIDLLLDDVDENSELPIYVNIHDAAVLYPALPEILAEKYRKEGGFDVLICFNDDNETELEIG